MRTHNHCSSSLVELGRFEDLHHLNSISVISQLGSRKYPISEIEVARPGVEPATPVSANQELNRIYQALPWIANHGHLDGIPLSLPECSDYFSTRPLLSINNPILMLFQLLKAKCHGTAAYGNIMPNSNVVTSKKLSCTTP